MVASFPGEPCSPVTQQAAQVGTISEVGREPASECLEKQQSGRPRPHSLHLPCAGRKLGLRAKRKGEQTFCQFPELGDEQAENFRQLLARATAMVPGSNSP